MLRVRRVNTPDGEYLIKVSDEYVAKALARGEIVETEGKHLVVVPQPIRELNEDEKRRIRLAKERKAR